jgi:hypothetical protein
MNAKTSALVCIQHEFDFGGEYGDYILLLAILGQTYCLQYFHTVSTPDQKKKIVNAIIDLRLHCSPLLKIAGDFDYHCTKFYFKIR